LCRWSGSNTNSIAANISHTATIACIHQAVRIGEPAPQVGAPGHPRPAEPGGEHPQPGLRREPRFEAVELLEPPLGRARMPDGGQQHQVTNATPPIHSRTARHVDGAGENGVVDVDSARLSP
jgi:hypothetical protein